MEADNDMKWFSTWTHSLNIKFKEDVICSTVASVQVSFFPVVCSSLQACQCSIPLEELNHLSYFEVNVKEVHNTSGYTSHFFPDTVPGTTPVSV